MQKSKRVFDEKGNCYCGSKRKYELCCKRRKPFPYEILSEIEIDPVFQLHSIDGLVKLTFIVNDNKEIIGFEDAISKEISDIKYACAIIYSNKKNRKSVYAMVPCHHRRIGLNDNIYTILDDFDTILGLDTNYNNSISFTKVCIMNKMEGNPACQYEFVETRIEFIARNRSVSDREAVYHLIQLVLEHLPDWGKAKVGIVIDSDLNVIKDISLKNIPLFGEYFLPDSFTLIYARDRPSVTPLNGLIKDCDKQANIRIAECLAGTYTPDPKFFKDLT